MVSRMGDAFPRDGSEWTDTDLDGIGNNADTDDDNDGVKDSGDAFRSIHQKPETPMVME